VVLAAGVSAVQHCCAFVFIVLLSWIFLPAVCGAVSIFSALVLLFVGLVLSCSAAAVCFGWWVLCDGF
jgi:hypothetical protein